VLFEEWSALRAAGAATPAIAAWPCAPAGSTTWAYLLDTLYNNATLAPLVWRLGGKMALFVPYTPSCYDPATVNLMESNGGRNDVVVVPMWALFGDGSGGGPWKQGVWGFFSPCTDAKGDFTTSIVGADAPCNQYSTFYNSTDGTGPLMEVSASGGYMLSQCALPFASPGHLRGLTLARLFEAVLARQPPHVFLSSVNEFIGGRQAAASAARIAFNMGLPADPQRGAVWVDTCVSPLALPFPRLATPRPPLLKLYTRTHPPAPPPSPRCLQLRGRVLARRGAHGGGRGQGVPRGGELPGPVPARRQLQQRGRCQRAVLHAR
jgi:hypothetical protein